MSKSRLLTPLLLGSLTIVSALVPVSSAFAACSDCSWLWLRCMKRADTPEKQQACDESRALCEETFCTNPNAAAFSLLPPKVPVPQSPSTDNAEVRNQDIKRSAQ